MIKKRTIADEYLVLFRMWEDGQLKPPRQRRLITGVRYIETDPEALIDGHWRLAEPVDPGVMGGCDFIVDEM